MDEWLNIWEVLGVDPGSDTAQVRRAYARELHSVHPEDDPEGFQRLRSAYEMALRFAPAAPASTPISPQTAKDAGASEEPATVGPLVEDNMLLPSSSPFILESGNPAAEDDTSKTNILAKGAPFKALRSRMQIVEDGLPPLTPPDHFEKEREKLRADMAKLATTLADKTCEEAERQRVLSDVLQSPILDNLAAVALIENQIAALLTRHLPCSDYVLEQAIAHFHWDDRVWQTASPEIQAVHQRIREWQFIQGVSDTTHPLYVGWEALTHPGRWTLKLPFQSSARAEAVAQILARSQTDLPGISYSFDARAFPYWQTYLSRLHANDHAVLVAASILAACSGTLLSMLAGGVWTAIVAAAIVLGLMASPWILLHGTHFIRERIIAKGRATWMLVGWLPAVVILPLFALIEPAAFWSPFAIGIAAICALTWMNAASIWFQQRYRRLEVRQIVLGFSGLSLQALAGIFGAQGPFQITFLITVAVAYSFKVCAQFATSDILNDYCPDKWRVSVSLIAAFAPALICFFMIRLAINPAGWVQTLCLMAVMETMVIWIPMHTQAPGWCKIWLTPAVIVLFVASFIIGANSAWTIAGNKRPQLPASAVPLAVAVPALGQPDNDVAEQLIYSMKRRHPGFAQIDQNDPETLAFLRGRLHAGFNSPPGDLAQRSRIIDNAIAAAMATKLPKTRDDLLVRRWREVVAIMREARRLPGQACLQQIEGGRPATLTTDDRRRAAEQETVFLILASKPISSTVLPPDLSVNRQMLQLMGLDSDREINSFLRALKGTDGAAAECDVKIRIQESILELPIPEAAQMIRFKLSRSVGPQ